VDGAATAAELAVINADTMHDTMLDDLLVMNSSQKTVDPGQQMQTNGQHRLVGRRTVFWRCNDSHMTPNVLADAACIVAGGV
jgi:hypothetical protein